MTVQDFKDKNPHLSHLEGNELWDAMTMAVMKENKFVPEPGDDEIVESIKEGEYTFNITKGAKRAWDKFTEDWKPPVFSNFGFLMPDGSEILLDEKTNQIIKK